MGFGLGLDSSVGVDSGCVAGVDWDSALSPCRGDVLWCSALNFFGRDWQGFVSISGSGLT